MVPELHWLVTSRIFFVFGAKILKSWFNDFWIILSIFAFNLEVLDEMSSQDHKHKWISKIMTLI